MCHDRDAAPPAPARPPLPGAPPQAGPLTLTSTDGTPFAAHLAVPERPAGPSVVVLPDNRGLSPFYRRLTVRLAEQGHPALAIDYFGRTTADDPATRDPENRGPEFGDMPNLLPHLLALTPDGLDADITAAADHLRSAGAAEVVALGFCFGGRQAFRAAAPRFGLAGAVGFYGFPDTLNGAPGPTQLAAGLTAPVLALWGGADEHIPPAAVAAFDEALTAAGTPHTFVTYPGAPHNFFELATARGADGHPDAPTAGPGDGRTDGHTGAAEDAWRRLLDFLAGPGRPVHPGHPRHPGGAAAH
ncbi:dienelactone hydrolase family protein [Kitasatospora sp. NPDC004240]